MAGRRFDRALHGGLWWPWSCWMASTKRWLCLWWWLVALFMLLVVGGSQHAFGGWWLSSCSWWPADVMLEYGDDFQPGSAPCTGGGGSSTCSSRLHALPDQPLARSTSGMDGMDKAECASNGWSRFLEVF
uniref:Candidate secreted effector n=1 Tax=Meloidogyne incognita TaxID=6306 RepID=A0A914LDD1_MELIC